MEAKQEATRPKQLLGALVKAQRAIGAVKKESRNTFANYDYASAEDLIKHSREALLEAGLALIVVEVNIRDGEPPIARIEYTLIHESGETMGLSTQMPIVVGKGKPMDKALATALTMDMGYTLRSLLLIPRVDKNTEADARDDTGYKPGKKQQRKPSRQAKASNGKSKRSDLAERYKDSEEPPKAAEQTEIEKLREYAVGHCGLTVAAADMAAPKTAGGAIKAKWTDEEREAAIAGVNEMADAAAAENRADEMPDFSTEPPKNPEDVELVEAKAATKKMSAKLGIGWGKLEKRAKEFFGDMWPGEVPRTKAEQFYKIVRQEQQEATRG